MSLLRLAAGLGAIALVAAVPFYAQSYPFAAPPTLSGHIAEGDGVRTCTQCHSSFELNSGTGSVAITAPATVSPGQTVPITITVTNTTPPAEGATVRQGFLATVRDYPDPRPIVPGAPTEPSFGTLTITDAVNTGRPTDGSDDYVSHTSTGTSQTSWTFDWTAPATEGVVATVYVAGNAANGEGTDGDYIYTARTNISVMTVAGESAPDALALRLSAPSPNPVRGQATARLTLAAPASVAVTIVDGRGRTVRTQPVVRLGAGAHTLHLATAGLAPGTYFVVAEADGVRQTQPVVVAR